MEVDADAEGLPLGRRDKVDEKRLHRRLAPVEDELCCCNPRDLDEGFVAIKVEFGLAHAVIVVAANINLKPNTRSRVRAGWSLDPFHRRVEGARVQTTVRRYRS